MSDNAQRSGIRWITILAVGWASVVILLAGCATAQGQREPHQATECAASVGELAAGASLESAAGTYRLTLVAPATGGSQRVASGTLTLEPNEPALRRFTDSSGAVDAAVSVPLYGWADINLAAVDALEIGDVGSRDPLRPGALVLEQRREAQAAASITLRLGSIANRRDGAGPFDGGYMAMHVQQVKQSGSFAGTWSSGAHARRVEGHFCATRLPATGAR